MVPQFTNDSYRTTMLQLAFLALLIILFQCWSEDFTFGLATSASFRALILVHTGEISTSTSTKARHTHAHTWLGSWMTDSARAYAWRLCLCVCLSHECEPGFSAKISFLKEPGEGVVDISAIKLFHMFDSPRDKAVQDVDFSLQVYRIWCLLYLVTRMSS